MGPVPLSPDIPTPTVRGSVSPAKWLKTLLVAALLLVGSEASASASPGDLDRSFGVNGISSPALGDGELARAGAAQADGKVIVAGSTYPVGTGLIMRMLPDGSLDQSFGQSGVAEFPGRFFDSVEVSPDGKIIAAGRAGAEPTIVRLLSDGTLDPDFANNGVFVGSPTWLLPAGDGTPPSPQMYALEILDDGRIMSGGTAFPCYSGNWRCNRGLTVRLKVDGTLDETYGTSGFRGYGYGDETVSAIGFRPSGQTLVAIYGSLEGAYGEQETYAKVDQYLAEGPGVYPEDSDTDDRWSTSVVGGESYPNRARLSYGSGAIVSDEANEAIYIASGTMVARLGSDGRLDTTFGNKGFVSVSSGSLPANLDALMQVGDLTVDGESRLLVSGQLRKGVRTFGSFLMRLNADGSTDPTFSNDGVATLWRPGRKPLPRVGNDSPASVVPLANGFALTRTSAIGYVPRVAVANYLDGDGRKAYCGGLEATYIGDASDETITLSGVIVAGAGDDDIRSHGARGGSRVCAGPGDDRVEAKRATVFGGAGDDRLLGPVPEKGRFNRSSEKLYGGPGNDYIRGFAGDDTLVGSAGNDRIFGYGGNDRIWGKAGNDYLNGGSGFDLVVGGSGFDRAIGGPTGRQFRVYVDDTPPARVSMVVNRGAVVDTTIRTPMLCGDPYEPGLTMWVRRIRNRLPFRGRQQRLSFSDYLNQPGFEVDEKLQARRRGKSISGRYYYTAPSRGRPSCRTGSSDRNPWVRFEAKLQPPLRQIVRP